MRHPHRDRIARTAALLLVASVVSCGPEPSAPSEEPTSPRDTTEARQGDYRQARAAAHAWLDGLEVDPVHLHERNLSGIKKLGRILLTYLILSRHPTDERDAERIRRHVTDLTASTELDAYHSFADTSEGAYEAYLLVLHMMDEFGLETAGYHQRLRRIKPRMDVRLAPRDNWERRLFANHYDRFGLEKPQALLHPTTRPLSESLPLDRMSLEAAYDLTHEVLIPFDYGLLREPYRLTDEDRRYLRHALPTVLSHAMDVETLDLAAELLSCMTYLGLSGDPVYDRAVDYLLQRQNANGSWGDYEEFRAEMGAYLDQHIYLHTTSVALVALVEVFDGRWPRVDDR